MIEGATDPRWLEVVLADLDALLVDQAHAEKKAAATAMSLVTTYPDHDALVSRLSALAIEELRHFRAVHRELRRRRVVLGRDQGDAYVHALLQHVRRPEPARLIDRLLVAGLIEARSRQRLELLAGAVPDAKLAELFGRFARAEAAHSELFRDLALAEGDADEVRIRLSELVRLESEIVLALPLRARIH